jgi:hypothetical protein
MQYQLFAIGDDAAIISFSASAPRISSEEYLNLGNRRRPTKLHCNATPPPDSQSATSLEDESGVLLESSDVSTFRHNVISGQWGRVMDSLEDMHIVDRDQLNVWSDIFFSKEINAIFFIIRKATRAIRTQSITTMGYKSEAFGCSMRFLCQQCAFASDVEPLSLGP